MATAQVYYEDVKVGDRIQAMEYLDQMQLVDWSVVSGNHDVNHFAIFRTKLRNRGEPSVTGQLFTALVDKMLMSWAGPRAWVRKLSTQYRAWEYFHDLKTISGIVTGLRAEENRNLVDVEIQVTRGDGTVTCKGAATIALPSRS